MNGQRIDFVSVDAGRFNQLVELWRDVASGCALPKVGVRIAGILPKYLNRDEGYCFPSDEIIASSLNTSTRNIGKGMAALETAGLIERQTMVKRDEKREAVGRLRRIYLTMPNQAGERNTSPEVNGTEVNGTPDVNGTNQAGERNTVFRITSDNRTSDKRFGSEQGKLGVYARETLPAVYGSDTDFLDAFDRFAIELTDRPDIGAGELESITRQAFDQATKSSDLFMPVYWPEICALRDKSVAEWFRQRTGTLIHRRAAA